MVTRRSRSQYGTGSCGPPPYRFLVQKRKELLILPCLLCNTTPLLIAHSLNYRGRQTCFLLKTIALADTSPQKARSKVLGDGRVGFGGRWAPWLGHWSPCRGVTASTPDRQWLGKNVGAADSGLWKAMALWTMLIRGNISGNMGKTS